MLKSRYFTAAIALSATLAFPLVAEGETDVDTIVATVNETEITLGHMIAARARLPEQYQQLPDGVLFKGILDQLIQQTALADTYQGELPRRVSVSIENERRSLIAGEVIEGIMGIDIDDDTLMAAYDKQYTSVEPEVEFNAAHILVETEEEAKLVKDQIEGGADFANVAREKSTGPSGPSGGSLGWFSKGMMVPEFETAVLELQDGEVSDPVETQFGWHVIKRLETRRTTVPEIESVREELELQIRQSAVQKAIEDMTANAKVDREKAEGIDPSLLSQTELLD